MRSGFPLDLVALVPGKDERETIDGLLSKRGKSLGISEINCRILVHPTKRPWLLSRSPGNRQPFLRQAAHALVIFDHDGSGQEERDASDLVSDLQSRLSKGGWNDRAEVIVVEPELEVWVWSESPEVEKTLGWSGQSTNLRTWLASRGAWPVDKTKPPRPRRPSRRHCVRFAFTDLPRFTGSWRKV